MTHKNIKYFNYARNMAMMSDYNRVHIGCVAVMNNKILSTGFNTTKSHPLQAHYNQFRDFHGAEMHNHTLHAEMSCLIPLWSSNLAWNKIKLTYIESNVELARASQGRAMVAWLPLKIWGLKKFITQQTLVMSKKL